MNAAYKGGYRLGKYTHESARGYLLIVLDILPIGNVADGEDGFGGFVSTHNKLGSTS